MNGSWGLLHFASVDVRHGLHLQVPLEADKTLAESKAELLEASGVRFLG